MSNLEGAQPKLGSQFGKGGTGLSNGTLAVALATLQNQKTVVLDGAAANTNIAVAGIKAGDVIQSAIMYAAGVPSDITSTVHITSAGNVQATGSTAGNKIVFTYYSLTYPS